MEKLKIYVSDADIHVTVLGKLTSGMVGAAASFTFSPEWSGLLKTAVFVGSSVIKDVILTGSTVKIPPECLARRGSLQVGVYGHLEDGTVVIPTVTSKGITIEDGTKPSGDTQSGYTPEKWAQMLGMIGDVSHLTTEDRSSLVAAINEIAGYKGMELDDEQIKAVIEYYFSKHPPTIGAMTMTGDLDMGGHRVKNVAAPEEDADAVNLGYLNENCAPAGYGLGLLRPTVIETRAEVDDLKSAGWWEYNSSETCCGYAGTQYGGIFVIPSMWSVTQFFFCRIFHEGYLKRFYDASTSEWLPWEWVNPPMVPGVEYRTTKRWNGKAVYAAQVDCGTISAGESTISTSFACTAVIGKRGMAGSRVLPFNFESARDDEYGFILNVTRSSGVVQITIISGTSNAATAPVYVQVYYTKD